MLEIDSWEHAWKQELGTGGQRQGAWTLGGAEAWWGQEVNDVGFDKRTPEPWDFADPEPIFVSFSLGYRR